MKGDIFPGLWVVMFISAGTYFLIHQFGIIVGAALSLLLTFVILVLFLVAAYSHGLIERHILRRNQKANDS